MCDGKKTVKLSTYRNQFPYVRDFLVKNKDRGIHQAVSEVALAAPCPAVVVYSFAKEIFGSTPEIEEGLEKAMKFYGETEIEE